MIVLRTLDALHEHARSLGRESGIGGVLVPTMGALHEGHASLISEGVRIARERRDPAGCIVSIFVNPTQFNEAADFERYPRTEEADLELSVASGAAAAFVPDTRIIYPAPPDPPTPVPPLPSVATEPGLEDAFRPGHFAGVCQVVARLFGLIGPAAAIFGEKDWQQLRVIEAMTREAGVAIDIIPAPTVREADGLAMSSRNRFLRPADRERALAIPRALERAGSRSDPADAERAMHETLHGAGIVPEYAVVRDAATLGPIFADGGPGRALIAARAGSVRLIDNALWPAR